ncbi:MAG: DUF790 family protein, partial [Ktedonobacterales bacterium]|nr:DUF790 family protein [Ktedonobacterales bacterium]
SDTGWQSADTWREGEALPLASVAEPQAPYATAPTPLAAYGRALRITLYGPQEVMGAPNQYGERLTRLCRALLGYRRQVMGEARARAAALARNGLQGSARVYLHGRPLLFTLDGHLLKLLRALDDATIAALPDTTSEEGAEGDVGEGNRGESNRGESSVNDTGDAQGVAAPQARREPSAATSTPARRSVTLPATDFDSSLEAHLFADFRALEAIGEAHGWHMEREPEPLLADGVILIPDFALTRGSRRVYLELVGYWRPGYRERKARKLATLRGRVDLVLAAPIAARAELTALGASFPLLEYEDAVSAQALLALLDRAYNDFARRLAALDSPRIRVEVEARGRVPVAAAMALLRCYTRTELAEALRRLSAARDVDAPVWSDGLGLCAAPWYADVLARLRAWVEVAPNGRLSLADLRQRLATEEDTLHDITEEATEALAARAGLTITRASIFEAEVTLAPPAAPVPPGATPPPHSDRRAQPRGGVRRKQHRASYITQPFLVPERADE